MLWLTKFVDWRNAIRVDQINLLFASALFPTLFLAGDLSANGPPITALAFDAKGDRLLVASQDGISELSWPELRIEREIATEVENVRDISVDPTGRFVAIAGGRPTEDGTIEILDWPGAESIQVRSEHWDAVTCVSWADEGKIVSGGMDHELVVLDGTAMTEEKATRLRGHSKGVLSLIVLPESNLMVSAGIDQNLRVWDTRSLELSRSLNNHTKTVTDMAAKPGPSPLPIIASASEDKTIRLWQPSIGRMIRFARLNTTPLQVDWYSDGSLLVAACSDGKLRVIDPTTTEVVEELEGIDGWAYALAVHPTDGSVAVGGLHGQLKRIILPTSPMP